MKTNIIVNSKARRIAFVMVCLLIASVGFAAKVTLNGLDQSQDQTLRDFMQPSQQYVPGASAKKSSPAAPQSALEVNAKEPTTSPVREKL